MSIPVEVEPIAAQIEQAVVTALYYYPIKSCAGIRLESAEIVGTGFLHDRELMIVESESNDFLTQRELPRMALIHPYIEGKRLRVEAPGMSPLEIEMTFEGFAEPAKVWKDTVQTLDQGHAVADWLSEFLDKPVRLVRMAPDYLRQVSQDYALTASDHVNFADGYEFLIISEESLADLNRRLDEPLPMNRFRPNIVISGSGLPFAEDYLRRFRLGEVVFQAVKPCARCPITTTNQTTAVRGKEPLKTLATFRRGPRGVMFGQNLIHENTGRLQLGTRVEVLQLQEPQQLNS